MSATGGKVLIVEDSRTERLILQKMVAQGGFELLVADDGVTGLELAITQKPDLILSDIVMPRLTGLEMCRMLKSREDTRHIPIIFLSGMDDMEQVVKGLEAGASDYLSKRLDSARQVIDTVEVNLRSSYRQRTGKELPGPGSNAESGAALMIGMELFDSVSCGIAVFSLRKQLLYANTAARRELDISADAELATIDPERFEPLIQAGAQTFFRNGSRYFHEVQAMGRLFRLRLEEALRPGVGIIGLLFFFEPALEADIAPDAPATPSSGEEEPLLPDW